MTIDELEMEFQRLRQIVEIDVEIQKNIKKQIYDVTMNIRNLTSEKERYEQEYEKASRTLTNDFEQLKAVGAQISTLKAQQMSEEQLAHQTSQGANTQMSIRDSRR